MGIGGERTRTNWTPLMERYFIDLLLDQMHRGNRFGHTFNKQAWIDMQTMLNAKFGCHYDKDILKSRYTMLWKQFNEVKNVLEQNEFSWDDDRKMVIANDYVWDAYIQVHPEVQPYKNKALRNFNDLCLIYAYTAADGRYSRSSHDLDLDDDIPGVNIDIGMGSLAPASHERSKADWTPAMDRYFIKLMLDQLKKGNKIDNTFSKQSWKAMLTLINAKFRSQYGKNFLKRRYKKLFKYYTDVRRLLERKGFSWDEKQQRILADDGVWDNYIKAHPDACSYRKKTLLNYQDLGLIYRNGIINGHLHQDKKFEDALQIKVAGEEKEGQSSVGFDHLRTDWTPPMDRYLIDLLQDQVLRGNKIGHAFVTQAWIEMVTLFNAKFGSHYDKAALKNRYKHLWRQYNNIKYLLEQNGFFWDDTREMVTAEDYVWDSYTKAHPNAQSYRNKSVPSYHKLCVIYGQESSNGRYSPSACNVDLDSEGPVLMIGEDIQCHANNDFSSTDWTPSMDRYLIDLMLEEVHQGNRIDHAFDNQLWIDMVVLFKDRFGSQHDKDVLRSRHNNLGKQYNDMKSLLDQSGFSWDETRQMVTANDDVWDVYMKEHPDVESYRNNTKPNYNDLCLIYGNSISELGHNQDIGFNGDGTRLDNNHGWRTDWTPPMDRYLIDLMLGQVREGSMIDHKFSKQAWGDMVAKFSAVFGSQYDKYVLKSRSNKLRKLFNDMRNLLDQNGFAWDEMRQVVTANNDMWDAYVKEHPDARSYWNRTLPNYNDLFFIYGNATASGRTNHSSDFMDVDNCCGGVKLGEEDEQSPAGSGLLRIRWTKPMDHYYIDLMLEQVQRGNKIDNTFKEQAWDWMVASLNEKFGLLCDKFELENRYLSLMQEYDNITELLNQNGFAWDETQQTVIAADDVWEAYIKEHPDAIRYRDRIVDNYKDLCRIADGRLSGLGIKRVIDDNSLDMGIDIFGGVQPPAREFKTTYQRKRRKSATSSTAASSRKVHRSNKEGIDRTLDEKPVGVSTMVENEADKDYSSIELIVDALQTIPDMNDDELFLEACALLEDERKAKMFVAMDVAVRRKWLLRSLRR